MTRLMVNNNGEIHEECPDCRGECCSEVVCPESIALLHRRFAGTSRNRAELHGGAGGAGTMSDHEFWCCGSHVNGVCQIESEGAMPEETKPRIVKALRSVLEQAGVYRPEHPRFAEQSIYQTEWAVLQAAETEIEKMATEETKPVEREVNPDEQRRRSEQWDRQVASLADYNAGYAAALERAAQEADKWASSESCDDHDDNPCCHVRTGAVIRDAIRALKGSR